jgi:hypothetical protein
VSLVTPVVVPPPAGEDGAGVAPPPPAEGDGDGGREPDPPAGALPGTAGPEAGVLPPPATGADEPVAVADERAARAAGPDTGVVDGAPDVEPDPTVPAGAAVSPATPGAVSATGPVLASVAGVGVAVGPAATTPVPSAELRYLPTSPAQAVAVRAMSSTSALAWKRRCGGVSRIVVTLLGSSFIFVLAR